MATLSGIITPTNLVTATVTPDELKAVIPDVLK